MNCSVALVLAAHMPYLRAAGRSHAGEEPIHELIAHVLLPTLNTLYDLRDLRLPVRVGWAYSPVLLEQLADAVVLKHFGFWLEERLEKLDTTLAAAEHAGETERAYLARFFREWTEGIHHSFDQRFGLHPLAALRQLCEEGMVEPLASAATFPRLTRLQLRSTLRAQIELGALAVARTLGVRAQGFWSPALRYRRDADALLVESGMHYVLHETTNGNNPAWLVPQRLVALSRDVRYDRYLTDAKVSYAGDPLYLGPTRDSDGFAWTRNGMGQLAFYDPYHAYRRVQEHASHFVHVLAAHQSQPDAPPLSIVALHAETIGMRWFEGAAWLRALLEQLANHQQLALVTPGAWLRTASVLQHETAEQAAKTPHTSDLFSLQRLLHAAETRLSTLAQRFPDARDEHERVLNQAARELLLAQSNEYAPDGGFAAPRRALHHLSRCIQLCDLAERETYEDADLTLLETFEQEDNSFAYLNYRVFAR